MKRFLGLAAVAALLVALPLSHFATAGRGGGRRAEKVTICHIPDNGGDVDEAPRLGSELPPRLGIVISVSANSLDAHCGHGDCNYRDQAPGQALQPGECVCYFGDRCGEDE